MIVIKRSTKDISRRKTRITEEWVCLSCGHSEIRTREVTKADLYDGGSSGGGIFGGGGSSHHSSGPSFGSFGGGSFSGGGAGGRF